MVLASPLKLILQQPLPLGPEDGLHLAHEKHASFQHVGNVDVANICSQYAQ